MRKAEVSGAVVASKCAAVVRNWSDAFVSATTVEVAMIMIAIAGLETTPAQLELSASGLTSDGKGGKGGGGAARG